MHTNIQSRGEASFRKDHESRVIRSVHPVVRVHRETGRRSIFVNPQYTREIVGLTPDESETVLACLYRHIARPEFTVRFRWAKDSIAVWDNRNTAHYAPLDRFRVDTTRVVNRVALLGDVPVGADGFVGRSLAPGEAA